MTHPPFQEGCTLTQPRRVPVLAGAFSVRNVGACLSNRLWRLRHSTELDLDQIKTTLKFQMDHLHRNGPAPGRQLRQINESLVQTTWAGQPFCLVASVALGLFVPQGQAYAQAELQAQAPACVVVEVAVEDREEFTKKLPSPVGKRDEGKGSKLAVQGGKTEPLSGSSSSSAEKSSTREKAFALGQNMADYCKFKIEAETR